MAKVHKAHKSNQKYGFQRNHKKALAGSSALRS